MTTTTTEQRFGIRSRYSLSDKDRQALERWRRERPHDNEPLRLVLCACEHDDGAVPVANLLELEFTVTAGDAEAVAELLERRVSAHCSAIKLCTHLGIEY